MKTLAKKAIRPALLMLLTGSLAGCLNYQRPPLAVDSSSLSKLQENEKQMLPNDLKTMTLEKAQEIALANNPNFMSIQLAIDSAQARYYQSYSSYAPTLNAGLTFQQSFGNINAASSGLHTRSQNDSFSPGISGQWLIFDSLKREMTIISNKYALSQSKADFEDARRLLLRATAYAYNDVRLAYAQKLILEAQLAYNKEMLADAERKNQAGSVLLSDVLNFRIAVRNSELNLEKNDNNIKSCRYILASYLGLTDGTIPDSVEFPVIDAPPEGYTADVEVYLDMALANRPDLKAYRDRLEQARYNYYASMAAFGPTVRANYSFSWNDSRGISHDSSGTGHSYSEGTNFGYSLSADWNLFNGLNDYYNWKAAAVSVAQSDFILYQTWLTVITDVRTAYNNFRSNIIQARISLEICKMTEETRDLVKNEYNAGTALVTRLNEAERELVQAQNNLATAIMNISNAKAQLDAAVYALSTPAADSDATVQEENKTENKDNQ